jgi:hypothetical protein
VRSKLRIIGLLMIVLALLSGCDLIDQFLASFGGSGNTGGGTGAVVSGRLEVHLAGTISRSDGTSGPGVVGATFYSGAGSYDPTTRTFTATWDGGDFSNTLFEARLNQTEEYIEYFYARQAQANVWGAWTYVHEIRGYNVLYSYTDGNSRYFIVDGSDAHVIVDLLKYRAWSASVGSATDPYEWVNSPGALTGSTDDIIRIRLDSQ